MITIKITQLGNGINGIYVFNQYNQLLSFASKSKPIDKTDKYIATLRKKFMNEGQSVYCKYE